jgi:hypothetical protein
VESHREKSLLSQHSLESTCELDLTDGESMTEMQRTVHVRIREGSHPFGLLRSDLGRSRSLPRDRIEIRAGRFGSISLEELLFSPRLLSLLLELDDVVSLGSLEEHRRLMSSVF